MKASELVERLNALIAEHGDLDVQLRQTEFMWGHLRSRPGCHRP